MRSDRTIVVVALLVILAAAAYEALVGLDIAQVGDPVDGAPGAAGLLLVAIGAVGLGGLVMFACGLFPAATERLTAVRELALVPVAGGLGFVAGGYLTAQALAERLSTTRSLTDGPIGVNLFVPGAPSDPAVYAPYVAGLAEEAERQGVALGEPRFDDDDWEAKLALLAADPVAVVSFTFGSAPPEAVAPLRAAGSEVWVTVTSPDEARLAAEAGADVVVVQGAEAGGHRATFVDRDDAVAIGLLALLQLVREAVDLPMVATGGIMTRRGVAAALAAGARAAGIRARIGLADVKNHLASQRLLALMQTDMFYYHGYTELWLGGGWVKATPAFNIELCERFGVKALEFDGREHALMHEFDTAGRRHMQYLTDHGPRADLPYAELTAAYRKHYPRLLAAPDALSGDMAAEMEQDRAQG